MLGIIGSVGSQQSQNEQKYLLTLSYNSDARLKLFIEVNTSDIDSISKLRKYVIDNGYNSNYTGEQEQCKVLPTKNIPVYSSLASGWAIPYVIYVVKISSGDGWGTNVNLSVAPSSGMRYSNMYVRSENWSLAYE